MRSNTIFTSCSSFRFKRMLQERRLALEREIGRAKGGVESEKTAVDGNILENLQHQLDIATKVNILSDYIN